MKISGRINYKNKVFKVQTNNFKDLLKIKELINAGWLIL